MAYRAAASSVPSNTISTIKNMYTTSTSSQPHVSSHLPQKGHELPPHCLHLGLIVLPFSQQRFNSLRDLRKNTPSDLHNSTQAPLRTSPPAFFCLPLDSFSKYVSLYLRVSLSRGYDTTEHYRASNDPSERSVPVFCRSEPSI